MAEFVNCYKITNDKTQYHHINILEEICVNLSSIAYLKDGNKSYPLRHALDDKNFTGPVVRIVFSSGKTIYVNGTIENLLALGDAT